MGYIKSEFTEPGSIVQVEILGSFYNATILSEPLYDASGSSGSFRNQFREHGLQHCEVMLAQVLFDGHIIVSRHFGQVFERCAPGTGERQYFETPVVLDSGPTEKALLFKRHCGSTDFCLVDRGLFTELCRGHASVPTQMKQDPPFRTQHAIAVFVLRLKITADQLCSLIEQIGQKM